jgi:hypothetical protein
MKIELQKEKDGLEIKKIEFVCDGGLHDKLNEYEFTKCFNKHSFTYIVAPPQSGKSNLTQNLFKNKNMLRKCFNKIYYFSPSSSSLKDDVFNKLPEEQRYTELTQANLDEVRSQIEGFEKGDKSCIVLDDCASALKDKELLRDFQRLIFNRRHIYTSVIIISQVYNILPLQLRKMVNNLIILAPRLKEFTLMNDEYFNLDVKNIKEVKAFFFDKKYNFLMYCPDENIYFKNFDKVNIQEE